MRFYFSSKGKLYTMPLTLLIVLLVIFFSIRIHLEQEEKDHRLAMAKVVAQQVTNSIEVFSADRSRAMQDLLQSWPDYHPNPINWFNLRATTMKNVLPGFDDLWWADENQFVKWSLDPTQRSQLLYHELFELGIDADALRSQGYNAVVRLDKQGFYHVLNAWAIDSDNLNKGYVVASFDVRATLLVMVGELMGPQFRFSMLDGQRTLLEHGQLQIDGTQVEQRVHFAGRQWTLILQTNNPGVSIGSLVFWLGAVMSFFVSLGLHRVLKSALKLSDSQLRYKAASESALDGILVYQEITDEQGQPQDFQLADANKVAVALFHGSQFISESKLLSRHASILGFDTFLQDCLQVARSGNPFEQEVQVNTELLKPDWIKVQVVKAGSDLAITLRDISVRHRNALMLKQSEAKFRRLVDGLNNHFIYSQRIDGVVEYVSNSVTDILGYDIEDFKQHHLSYVRKRPQNEDAIQKQLERGQRPAPYIVEYKSEQGEIKLIEYSDSPVFDEQGSLQAIEGIGRDVTRDMELRKQVYYQANHDQLTGLLNRYAFDRRLQEMITDIEQQGGVSTMCYIDMDRFKLVNDTCGHQAGDQLLRHIADILGHALKSQDILARVGGDEFCLILADTRVEEARPQLQLLLESVQAFRFIWDEKIFHVGASIGVVEVSQERFLSANELIKQADNACYMAKNAGRNRYHVYDTDAQDVHNHQSELQWMSYIQKALEKDRFALYFQTIEPLNAITNGEHYEILLRMRDEQGDIVSPGAFIPAAERYGLMPKIDQWVFEHTLKLLESHPEHLKKLDTCAINLSGASLSDESLLKHMLQRIKRSNVPAHKLCFEITETSAVTNLAAASKLINALRELGCKFALDDFGAGMSSFTYLKNMAVDYVKIDGSFVRNLCNDASDYAAVKAIHDIASTMGKMTVAEFVADDSTRECLKSMGISYAQGYAISKPMSFSSHLKSYRMTA